MRAAFIILLAFSSVSCLIVTQHPLIDSTKSEPDKRLEGRWVGTGELRDVYAVFEGDRTLETNILGKGSTEEEMLFDVATGPIGRFRYMSLKLRNEVTGKGYLLARYSIEGDELNIWLLNSPLFDAAISRGRLKSDKGGSSMTMLTDSPRKLVRFIEEHENALALFQHLGTFKRERR